MTEERPWLKPHAVNPAATEPQPATRLRPLIYVYDLPSDFNTRLLQVGCMSPDWPPLAKPSAPELIIDGHAAERLWP